MKIARKFWVSDVTCSKGIEQLWEQEVDGVIRPQGEFRCIAKNNPIKNKADTLEVWMGE